MDIGMSANLSSNSIYVRNYEHILTLGGIVVGSSDIIV